MAKEITHYLNEPDIGSGEKTAAQHEIDQEMQSIPTPSNQTSTLQNGSLPGRILQRGDHIARILATEKPDNTYEAQVFVRLAREPELAETFIPAGIYGTEADALTAAEVRANRAIEEHEF